MSLSQKNAEPNPPNQPSEDLAGEYALGILSGEEKENAEFLFASNPSFRAKVEAWHTRLAPVLNEVEEAPAPLESWSKLENHLFGELNRNSSKKPGIWSSIALWRSISFTSLTTAAILAGAIYLRPALLLPDGPDNNLVAALNQAEDKPTFLVQIDASSQKLNIRAANLTETSARVPELWLIPEDGVPRSLGLIAIDGTTTLNFASSLLASFKSGAILTISLEPAGGALKGKPTGPIIATGPLQYI